MVKFMQLSAARKADKCPVVGHDFRLLLATRVGRGNAWGEFSTPATMLVTACSRCGERP
jgi:hypothetical protein